MTGAAFSQSASFRLGPWAAILLGVLLFADLYHAGRQYYQTPLDGDMPSGILITWDVQHIFDDPFGFAAIRRGHGHANPNRFFCHWAFARYFQHVPILLQQIVDPLRSVYLACALVKLFIHVGLVLLLAAFVRAGPGRGWGAILLLCVLVSPMIQTETYRPAMAIIDHSITYTFFYALPATGLLILVWCFHRLFNHGPDRPAMRILLILFILAFSFILSLSGPLVAPSVLLGVLVLAMRGVWRSGASAVTEHIRRHKLVSGILFILIIMCVYSLYLGTYNTIEDENIPPLSDLYARLPKGLHALFTEVPAIPILLGFILLNMIILHLIGYSGIRPLQADMGWFLLFISLYVALLPFGGYRPWRENLIRFDTMIPFTLGLLYFHLATSWRVILNLRTGKWVYGLVLAGLLVHFTLADLHMPGTNECQKQAIRAIADSPHGTVALKEDCHVISWHVITDPEHSVLQGELLWKWRIIDTPRTFYFQGSHE